MKRLVVAFSGASNSGKTTLILKVSKELIRQNFKVAIIKNDPKDKARFDVEGKDSYLFSQVGAEVVVTSPNRTTFFSHTNRDLNEIIKIFGEFDFLFVEGHRGFDLPRILVVREKLDIDYLKFCDVLAIDSSIDRAVLPKDLAVLDLNKIDEVIEWIFKNAKEI